MTREGEGEGPPPSAPEDEREHLELAHHHPGRLRVRADALIEALDVVQAIREALDALPGILAVRYTAQTGSLLVEYEPGHADADAIILRIADVAGLSASYDAWHASLHGKPAPVIDGLTGAQRFFLAYAQTRQNATREATLRQQILTDGHAPSMYRAQAVRNIDAWYDAFKVGPDEHLYLAPAQRVRVW